MPERILFPEWRDEHEATKYPFANRSTLSNNGKAIVEGTFLDAALYPIGGGANLRLSQVVVDHELVTLYLGDAVNPALASGSFALADPPDQIVFNDAFGRPAGLLVSEGRRLALFGTWGAGTHTFDALHTEFAATVCFPMPAIGVRGIQLDDGTLLTGAVWLVGDDGVVLRHETITAPESGGGSGEEIYHVIRVDVVGDPLFRRRLCVPAELFVTPKFVRTLTFKDMRQTVICGPDANGDIKITVNNDLADDTVLRVRTTPEGPTIEAVGSVLKDVG